MKKDILYGLFRRMSGGVFLLSIFWGWGETSIIETIRSQNTSVYDIEQTRYDVDDEGVIAVPTFTMTYPQEQPVVDIWGRIDPESMSSVIASDASLWLCSRIARENLSFLTHLPYYIGLAGLGTQAISQHDAVWLIQHNDNTLQRVEKENILIYLDNMTQEQQGTLVDVYMYQPVDEQALHVEYIQTDVYSDRLYQSYVQQGHRAVFFLGTDNERWVLDPLLGDKSARPQRADAYIYHEDLEEKQRYVYPQPYRIHTRYQTSDGVSLTPRLYDEKKVLRSTSFSLIYRKPSLNSPLVTTLEAGKAMEVLDEKDAWYEIRTAMGIGWIEKGGISPEIYQFPRDKQYVLAEHMRLQHVWFFYIDNMMASFMSHMGTFSPYRKF